MNNEWSLLGVRVSLIMMVTALVVCEKPPQTGTIEVRSEPQGADVFLDDSLTGMQTNCVLEEVPFGTHILRVRLTGYFDWVDTVDVDEGEADPGIYAGLTEAPAAIQLNSTPQGAAIWLNEAETGQVTNHLFADLEPDTYTVKLVLEGYDDWETTVFADRGDTVLVEADFDTTVNQPPQIISVAAAPNPVEPLLYTTITGTATDPDGDNLSYEWYSVSEDTTYTAASFMWQAPSITGDFSFYLTVSDGNGGYDYDSSLVVTVDTGGIAPVTMLPPFDIGSRKATLIWTSADPSWYKYELYRSEIPDVHNWGTLIVTYSYDNGYNRLDTTYTDIDLEPGRDYYYAVLVADSAGNEAWSNEIKLTTVSFELLGSQPLGGGHGVRLVNTGNYVFCAAREQAVKEFTITAAGPNPAAVIPHPNNDLNAWAYDLAIAGSTLHTAFGKGGYVFYDVTNPQAPDSLGLVDEASLMGEARAVYAYGSDVFIGTTDPSSGNHILHWYSVPPPFGPPVLVDTTLLHDVPTDIYVHGNYVYAAVSNAGVETIHWSQIDGTVTSVSLTTTNDAANGVYVSNDYAYVASSSEGLVILDVSSPASPFYVQRWIDELEGNDAQGLYFSATRCYLADGVHGLRVLDMSDPLNPVLVDTKDISLIVGDSKLMDVWITSGVGETWAVLADWYNALHMIEW